MQRHAAQGWRTRAEPGAGNIPSPRLVMGPELSLGRWAARGFWMDGCLYGGLRGNTHCTLGKLFVET